MDSNEKQFDSYGMILRTVMSAIPALAPLATWWSEYDSKKNAKRVKFFIDSLNALTSCHSKELDAIKDDVSRNEERITILEATLDKVVKEWQQGKIQLHAQLLVRNMLSRDPIQVKMSILERFSELSIEDLNILRVLLSASSIQVSELHQPLEDIIPILCKLESRGLITQTGHGHRLMWSAPATDDWRDQWNHKFYTATPLGKQLWDAINTIR